MAELNKKKLEKQMFSISDYDFELPEAYIAQVPQKRRDQSRLLALNRKNGNTTHHTFCDLYNMLLPDDLLVVNNTEVIPGRLLGHKDTGGKLELLILDYAENEKNRLETNKFVCRCLIKASKGPKQGSYLLFDRGVKAEVLGFDNGVYTVKFLCEDEFETVLMQIGNVPLPPYIKRNDGTSYDDAKTYQTVYASQKGAIAAPTAGLHFTDHLLEAIQAKGVTVVSITLHVGYGTFLPVRVTDIREHQIHSEWYDISDHTAAAINRARLEKKRIIAVGTTSVRTLEYASDDHGVLNAGKGSCDLFIYPGYKFKVVDAMITNFHLPRSTLIMLVAAFAKKDMILNTYKEAMKESYRFYSYGDAMFIY